MIRACLQVQVKLNVIARCHRWRVSNVYNMSDFGCFVGARY